MGDLVTFEEFECRRVLRAHQLGTYFVSYEDRMAGNEALSLYQGKFSKTLPMPPPLRFDPPCEAMPVATPAGMAFDNTGQKPHAVSSVHRIFDILRNLLIHRLGGTHPVGTQGKDPSP